MTRARTMVWLIAVIAFVVPSFGAATVSHAMMPAAIIGAQTASVDCPDHAPPPKPCPDQGTAKHAASQCCPLMSGTVALLPLMSFEAQASLVESPLLALADRLKGFIFTQDPPPPRV